MMDITAADIEEVLRRNDFLFRNVPHCLKCGSEQVQIRCRVAPAVWRCRICKHRFIYEPITESPLTNKIGER